MELFQMPNRAFDDMTLAILRPVEAAAADWTRVSATRQHGARAMPTAPRAHRTATVALIAGQRVRVPTRPAAPARNADAIQERCRPAQVVRLAGFHGRRERQPASVGHQGELRAESAAAAP